MAIRSSMVVKHSLIPLFLLFVTATSSVSVTADQSNLHEEKPLLILISSDGFRYGYQWKVATPNIERIRENGVEAFPGLIPVFPTMTFPNHYSIATGLHPPWHGIVANYFRDGDGDNFEVGNIDPKWWLGEPIWQTAAKHGLKSATIYWPGSEVKKNGWDCNPIYCPKYNSSTPFEDRVDYALSLIDLPFSQRPDFVALYLNDPDSQGHKVGPDDQKITDAVAHVDRVIGRLLDGLEARNISKNVNIILVGDHGMVGICDEKTIYIEDFSPWVALQESWFDMWTPLFTLWPPAGYEAKDVYANITAALGSGKVENGEHLKVYLKEDLPERLHYSSSERIAPIVGLVAEGYNVELTRSGATKACAGSHGYDNAYFSMRSIFFASGPRFQKELKLHSFSNVEIYNMMVSILGIPGAPNNGTLGFSHNLFITKGAFPRPPTSRFF